MQQSPFASPEAYFASPPHPRTLPVASFLRLPPSIPLVDVRSSREFRQGHIPQAHSLPLLDDEARAVVGTLYKQQGRDKAVAYALSTLTPTMADLIARFRSLCTSVGTNEIALYCWRGGDRSSATAHLLEASGFIVHRLEGGYKAFRQYVLQSFSLPCNLYLLAGKTGTGKTEILHLLKNKGKQVLDLEHLARHRGSVFGGLDNQEQPSCEHFENRLACCLMGLDAREPVWVEDESEKLGKVRLPRDFFLQMRSAKAVLLDAPDALRLTRILREYGDLPRDVLQEGISKIHQRLGGAAAKIAYELLQAGDIPKLAGLLLGYYDKTYAHQMDKRSYQAVIPFSSVDAVVDALVRLDPASL